MKLKHNSINYSVTTVDALLTLVGEENDVVVVTDENRGGTFVYRSADSATNNGGTIFNGWTRQYDGAVNVKWFGAKCNLIDSDTASVQKAIDYCSSYNRWLPLEVTGRCLLGTSINIDRLVDNSLSEFRIIANGEGAGFYTNSDVVMFDSTIEVTTAPLSEFITFEGIQFETSSVLNESYVLSEKFLRIKFLNCNFRLIRCVFSNIYVQTMYFTECNIRNNMPSFINCVGLYDVVFTDCIIENGNTIVRNTDNVRGNNGLRFIGGVVEGMQSSIVIGTGMVGFDYIGIHNESNFSPEFNFFGGTLTNKTINFIGNYFVNTLGSIAYYGTTEKVTSQGNNVVGVGGGVLHDNDGRVSELISIGDNTVNGISNSPNVTKINGVELHTLSASAWTDTSSHLTKNIIGEFGFGSNPIGTVRAFFKGSNQLGTHFSGVFADSVGNATAYFKNDRKIGFPALLDFTNDTTASVGGIGIGELYRTGSTVKVRVS
jgi:hypothetical protein